MRSRTPLIDSVLLGLLLLLVLPGRGLAQTDVLLESARSALDAGRAPQAEAIYRSLVETAPGLIDAHRGLARSVAAQGRSSEAVAGLRQLGEGLLGAGRYELAAEVLAEGVDLDPEEVRSRFALGRALMLSQRFGDAVPHLEHAIGLGASAPRVRVYLGLAQWESGAIEAAEETLRGASSDSLGRQQLGRLLLWKGRHSEAVGLLEGAAQALPTAVDLRLDLARALEGAGRNEEALAAYDAVIGLDPDRYPPRYNRARLLMRLGRRDEARTELGRYEELYRANQERLRDEGRVRARLARAWEMLDDSRPEQAAVLFAEIGEQPDALFGLALARSALGEHGAAVTALERAVVLAPDRQDLRAKLLEEREAADGP